MSKKFKIAHSLDELQDQIILTLKDRLILNDGKLNLQEQDILQNDDIQYQNEAKHNVELKAKLKTISDAASSHLQAKNQGLSTILPHYEDYSYKPNTIDIEQGAVVSQRKFKKSKAVASDYQQNQSSTTRLNSEYAPNKFGKASKTKTSSRDLLNFLENTAQDNVVQIKKQIEADDIINGSIDILKKKRILQNGIKNIYQNSSIDDEEQSLLLKSIQRSRKKRQETSKQQAFNVLQAIKEQEHEQIDQPKGRVQIQMNPIGYRSSEGIRQDKKIDLKEAVGGTTSAMFLHLPSERLTKKTVQKVEEPTDFKSFSKEELERMRAEVQFLQDKQVGIGISGALNYLRENALIGKEEQVGRHNDKNVAYNDPNDKIRLQYRNASGKLMKPKEAYRYICAKFHGEGPGKNKVEKRKRRQLQQIRAKQNLNEGGNLLKLLDQHQQKTGQAHLIVNLGGKAASRPT